KVHRVWTGLPEHVSGTQGPGGRGVERASRSRQSSGPDDVRSQLGRRQGSGGQSQARQEQVDGSHRRHGRARDGDGRGAAGTGEEAGVSDGVRVMAQNSLVAAKVEVIAQELALRVNKATMSDDDRTAIEQVEVWLCDLARDVRSGQFD